MTGGQPPYEWGSRNALRPGTVLALDVLINDRFKSTRLMAAARVEHDVVQLVVQLGRLADENEALREQNAILRELVGQDGPVVVDGWRVA